MTKTRSTLDVIQSIEEEARSVEESYNQQVQTSKDEWAAKLVEDRAEIEKQHALEIQAIESDLKERLKVAQNELDQTTASYKAKSERALTNKREELIQYIIKEVVDRYGD